jgi:hypothetical protein
MYKYITLLIILFLIGLVTSCGPYQVNVTHKIEIDLTQLENYFRAICEEEQPQNIEGCVDAKTSDFLNKILL